MNARSGARRRERKVYPRKREMGFGRGESREGKGRTKALRVGTRWACPGVESSRRTEESVGGDAVGREVRRVEPPLEHALDRYRINLISIRSKMKKSRLALLVEDAAVLWDQVHGRLECSPACTCTLEKVGRQRLKDEDRDTGEDFSVQVDIL